MFNYSLSLRNHFIKISFLLFIALNLVIFFKVYHYYGLAIKGTDGQIYYAQIRSLVIDRDLDFKNEFNELTPRPHDISDSIKKAHTVTGKTPNRYPAGYAALSAPFFIAAHGITKIGNFFSWWHYPENGYSQIYDFLVPFGFVIYSLLGFGLCFLFLKEYFGSFWAFVGMATIWFSTSLVYYATNELCMPHAGGFFLCSALCWLTQKYSKSNDWYWVALILVASCLAVLVRYSNIVFLILPIWIAIRKPRQNFHEGINVYRFFWGGLIVFFILGAQAIIWKIIYNTPFAFTHNEASIWLSSENLLDEFVLRVHQLSGYFSFTSPKIQTSLFSNDNGLFWWQPITLLSIGGLVVGLFTSKRTLCWVFLAIFLALLYINSAWYGVGFGHAFGARAYTELSLVFAFGLLCFCYQSRGWAKLGLLILCSLACFLNMFLYFSYLKGSIPASGILDYAEIFSLLGLFHG